MRKVLIYLLVSLVVCLPTLEADLSQLVDETLSARLYDSQKRYERTVDEMKDTKHISGTTAYKLKTEVVPAALKSSYPDSSYSASIDQMKSHKFITGKTAHHLKMLWHYTYHQALSEDVVSHDELAWKAGYAKQSKAEQKRWRASIYEQTKAAVLNGYVDVFGSFQELDIAEIRASQKGNTLTKSPSAIQPAAQDTFATDVAVYNEDTIELALMLQQQGLDVVALNLANANHPGGGAVTGASAQEESLFRRTDYVFSLNPYYNPYASTTNYKIPEFGVIYTPGVHVIRQTKAEGFAFVSPVSIDFIAAAGYNLSHTQMASATYETNMKKKIRAILREAYYTGHDAVVLGALGAGAFKNDPQTVADLFAEVLLEAEFRGVFHTVAFAVMNDHNGQQNYTIFDSTLSGLVQ